MTDSKLYWLLMLFFFGGQGYHAFPEHPAKNLFLFGVITIAGCIGTIFDRWKTKYAISWLFAPLVQAAKTTKEKNRLRKEHDETVQVNQASEEPIRRGGALAGTLALALLCLLFTWLES